LSFPDVRLAVLVGTLVLGATGSASAQAVRSDRPFRGLFGADGGKERGQTLAVDWSLLTSYDTDMLAETDISADSAVVASGVHGGATGGATYTARGQHVSFSANGTAGSRYYPDGRAPSAFHAGAGLGFASDLGRRTKIDATQSFAYEPYHGINFMGAAAPAEDAPVAAGEQTSQIGLRSLSSFGLDGRVGLTRTLGPVSSIRADYSHRSVRFSGGDETSTWRLANVTFLRSFTRHVGLRAGYGYGVGRDTGDAVRPPIVNHNLDLGIDYNRQLSFSRRTQVNFSSGSTAVVDSEATKVRLIGTVGLTQEIGRTWRASLNYNRGAQYLPGFGEMLFADTAHLRIGGLVSRRVEASATAGVTSGTLGLENAAGSSYWSATAGADLRVAMSRTLSFFAEYSYYRYGFDTGVQVPFGLPPQLDRQAIQIGISGRLPLVR
jgi:hypothetical protein